MTVPRASKYSLALAKEHLYYNLKLEIIEVQWGISLLQSDLHTIIDRCLPAGHRFSYNSETTSNNHTHSLIDASVHYYLTLLMRNNANP